MTRAHSQENGCRKREDGQIVWQGRCECGWEGPERDNSTTRDNAHWARDDYRDHIESELGDMAYYEAPVVCINCSYEGPARLLVGTDVFSGTCAVCGAGGRLRPNNDGWNESREQTRGLFG